MHMSYIFDVVNQARCPKINVKWILGLKIQYTDYQGYFYDWEKCTAFPKKNETAMF